MYVEKSFQSERITEGERENLVFDRCIFRNCYLGMEASSSKMPVLRKAQIVDCIESACHVRGAVFDDVLVKNSRTILAGPQPLILAGCVYRKCVFVGTLGSLQIRPDVREDRTKNLESFFGDKDYAIDISDAEFASCDISGVPVHLIRRDPNTQVFVERGRLIVRADVIDTLPSYVRVMLQIFMQRGDDKALLVAPKLHSRFSEILKGFHQLREEGLCT